MERTPEKGRTMKVFWFDCETSGVDPMRHGIISLAFMVEIDGTIKESGQLFSNCAGQEIDDSALQVNGFTREEIAGHETPQEMYRALLSLFDMFVNKYDPEDKFYAAGFNADFDLGFLRELWKRMGDNYFGSWFFFRAIDPSTVVPFLRYAKLAREPFPKRQKLVDLAAYFGLSTEGAHDAFVDIRLTRELSRSIVTTIGGWGGWFDQYARELASWAEQTFGPGPRTEQVVDHMKKEIVEVLAKPRDPTEWADVIMLAIDGALRMGIKASELRRALVEKLQVNRVRSWPDWRTMPEGRAVEHVRCSCARIAAPDCPIHGLGGTQPEAG